MSTTIDTNVVQMKFDNKQFEENCKQSMDTLDRLKQKINDSSSGNALDGLNKVDTSHLIQSVDSIANRFTFLGNLAFKIKDKIADAVLGMAKSLATTVPSIIKEGGWQRAMNIEEAKFQLEGLKVAWKDISDDISYAVDGTAYGLDAAAKAASQLVASGVEVGDSMKNALRAISGVAAMTNSEYESISPIFTTVAGQGKLMTMQLRQLENRGLNAAAVIGEALGKTEAEVRDMVTKGEIDFNTFANAMDSAFGEHAKDANRTFTGVTANIRAALKKIGADFSTPIIEQDGPVIQALQQLRLRINDIRTSLGPLTEAWTNFVNYYGTKAAKLLESIDMSFMDHVVSGLVNGFQALLNVVRPVLYAIKDIFAPSAASNINSIASAFESLTKKLILSTDGMENLRATIRGILSIGDILITLIKQILGAILQVKPETVNIGEIILSVTGKIGNLIIALSQMLKKTNIVKPVITALGTVFKILTGAITIAITNIIKFVNYISKLEITTKVINGIKIAITALLGVIVTLAAVIKDFVTGAITNLPGLLESIKTKFTGIIDTLKQIQIVQKVVDGITKLTDALKNLFGNSKVTANVKEIEGAITIVDEAVPLAAGPKKVNMLNMFGSALLSVKDKIVAVGSSVLDFIKKIDYGAVAAVAFTVAIAGIGYKLSKTFQAVADTFMATQKAINNIGGLIGSFKDRSIMEIIFGKKDPPQSHKLLEFAAAVLSIGVSFKVLSTIDVDKLILIGEVFAGIGTGMLILVGALTVAQKILGKGEAITMSSTLFSIAGSIGLLTASLMAATYLDFTNIQKAGLVIVQLAVVLGGLSIAMAKLAPTLSKGALSLIAMALSIKILIGALDKLNNIKINANLFTAGGRMLWGKAGLLMTIAGGLVIISGIASKLGTSSLLGIVLALGSLKIIVPLATSVAEQIKNSPIADAWNKLVNFFANIKAEHPKLLAGIAAFLAVATAIAGVIGAIYLIKKAFVAIASLRAGVSSEVQKFAGLQKALSRLSLVPVIVALTGMMVAIGVMVVVLGKIKLPYIDQAINIMTAIGLMFITLAVVVAASKNAKPGAIIGAMVGITMLFSELIVLTLLIEKHWVGMIGSCVVMAALMLSLAAVFNSIAKASEVSGKTLVAIGMIGAIIAELGGIIYALSQQDWKGVAASGAAMSVCMLSFAEMISKIGEKGQSWTKNKYIAIAECAAVLPIIAGSLLLATLNHDWAAMLAAGASMSAVMVVFGSMMNIIGKVKWDSGAWGAVAGIAISAVAIGGALALATLNHDWQAILAAAGAMSGVMLVFSGMAVILSKFADSASVFISMASIALTAVGIAISLSMLAQYPWQDILMAAGILVAVGGLLGVLAGILGTMAVVAVPGAIVLDLLAVAMLGISAAISMFLNALTTFIPVASIFVEQVLGTLTGYADILPSTSKGLLSLAAGLAAVGAAGIVLTAGALGLGAASLALPGIVTSMVLLSKVDLIKIASGLKQFVVPGLLVGPIGLSMGAGAPGILLASAALTVFAGAIALLSKTLDSKLVSNMSNIPKQMTDVGKWIPKSIVSGISSEVKNVIACAKNMAGNIISTIRNVLGIHSESKEINGIGQWISKSLSNGVIDAESLATKAADLLGGDTLSTITGYMGDFSDAGFDLGSMFGDGLESTLSNVEQMTGMKLSNIKNMFSQMSNFSLTSTKKTDSSTSANDAKKEQIAARKKEAEATKEATEALEDYTTATSNAGSASSKTEKEVKDLTDAFKAVEKGTKVSLQSMTNNLYSNIKETASWAKDMKTLMGKGFDSSITDWIKKMGVGGHETVKAFMTASSEQVAALNAGMKKWLTLDEDAENYILGNYEAFGGQIMEVLSDAVETWDSALAETIQNAVSPFAEFDAKTEMTGNQLLANMNSQLVGIRQWGANLQELMARNVDEGIIDEFKKMGPASYEQVNAMVQMTDAQLAEANDIWNQQLNLGQEVAMGIAQKSREVGRAVSDGLTEGINFNEATEDGAILGNNLISGAKGKNALDSNSPSKKFIQIGKDVSIGLDNGIRSKAFLSKASILKIAQTLVTSSSNIINFEKGKSIGGSFMEGLKSGIDNGESTVINSIKNTATSIINAAKSAFNINSPSKVFRSIGLSIDEGLAQGIDWGTDSATGATQRMADSTIQMMNEIIEDISKTVDDGLDFVPVIRPELDLTAIQNGKASIGSILGDNSFIASRMASGVPNSTRSINVTSQNNNTDVVSAISGLRRDLTNMTEQITNMQVILDGQTIVGELTPAIDNRLGMNAIRAGRGN